MKIIRPRTFVIFASMCLSGVALLHTSQSVRRAEKEVSVLRASIAREEERIRMLKAEWVHLNRPERLEKLAQEFLDLQPPETSRLVIEADATFPQASESGGESEDEAVTYEEEAVKAQAVSLQAPPIPAAKPPIKPIIKPAAKKYIPLKKSRSEDAKDFGALLDELGAKGGDQ